MKIIMEFEDPEEYHAAWHGPTYRSTLRVLDERLRHMLKYENHSEPINAICQELRDLLREECQEAMRDGEL